jgi:hypothetical protein
VVASRHPTKNTQYEFNEFFDQGEKPALGKTIKGKTDTVTCGNTISKGSGF